MFEFLNVFRGFICRLQHELEDVIPSSTFSSGRADGPAAMKTQMLARRLRAHLETLDGVRNARNQVVERARRVADADDIQQRIKREAAGIELWTEVKPAMFEGTIEQELSKYEKYREELDESAERQSELLEQIRVCVYEVLSTNWR